MTRALVIGGTGFLGLNLVDHLLAQGTNVRVTRRKKSITAFVRKRPVELVHASLDDPGTLRTAMEGCDVVYLTAGYYPRYSIDLEGSLEEGVRGVRNACAAALDVGVQRFVYTSSIVSLGQAPEGRPANETDIPPSMPEDSVYRAVKWAMERELDRAVDGGLHAVTLLPGGFIGPWDVRLGTGAFMVGVIKGLMPWWVDGLVHLVDVGDVARAHAVAAERAPAGARYCVPGHSLTVGSYLARIVRRYGGCMPPERLDIDAARERADAEERMAAPKRERAPVPREMVDIIACGQPVASTLAEQELGVEPAALNDTLDRAHAWFVRFRYLPAATADTRRSHECR